MRRAAWALAVSLSVLATPAAQAPLVSKVDPPGWWPGHSLNPVRLLVGGRHLNGARIDSPRTGVRVGPIAVSASGTTAFVDVHIDPHAQPGPAELRLVTSAGAAPIAFDILSPLARAGRFQGLSEDDVIYSLMPDRFDNGDRSNDRPSRSADLFDRSNPRFYHGGDLQGVIDRLPYLQDLGVTTIWMNPVYDNADVVDPVRRYDGRPFTDYHGYGAIDFYAVDEHFGDVATFRRLVDAAHVRGMKVMQDQVANHTGPLHPWVQNPPSPTWFNGSPSDHLPISFDAHVLMDPRASSALRRAVLDGWFADILPDLNQRDAEVSRYLIQNSLWWVGMTGLDAIRQDTVPYVPRAFWRDWTAALAREYPSLRVVGEVLDATPAFVAKFQRGYRDANGIDTGMHALFDYPLYFALRRVFLRGASLRDATSVLHQDGEYPDPDRLVTLVGSHDVRRFMGETGATIAGLKLAATFLFTTRGIPQWYYGDEIAMPGGGDPDNRRDFPGGWPDDPRNAFDANERSPDEQEVFVHVRTLLHLRRAHEPLRRGRLIHLFSSEAAYVFARASRAGTVVIALNRGEATVTAALDVSELGIKEGTTLRDRLGGSNELTVVGGQVRLTLPPLASAVFGGG